MSQPLLPNSTPQDLSPDQSFQQKMEDSTVEGGIQGIQGNNNIQIQGSGNQINLMLPLDAATVEQTKKGQAPRIKESELIVNSSENWILLQGHFFQADNVRQHSDSTRTLQISSENAQDDATLQSLCPDRWRHSQLITFAYRNNGFLVKIEGGEVESRHNSYVWTFTLKPVNIQYGGSISECSYQGRDRTYSANDIAELRGRRLLLNDPLQLVTDAWLCESALIDRQMFESLIQGIDTPVKVENCVLLSLYLVYRDRPELFLKLARLVAIFSLKAGGVVEQVLELSLGPIDKVRVHVRFQGKRRKLCVNHEPAVIEIEGDCHLE